MALESAMYSRIIGTMKHFKLNLWLLLISVILGESCKKDDFEHPELKTTEVVALSPIKVRITGEIVHTGKHKIQDYGFIYGTSSYINEETGTKISLGADAPEGKVTKEITLSGISSSYERTIYARLYLKNDKGTAYGDVISVQLPATTISGLSPNAGKIGDQIVINGNFSTLSKDEINVAFGGTSATILAVDPGKITVKVPSGINITSSSNNVDVKIFVAGLQTGGSYTFYITPTILDFSPKNGTINSTVIISAADIPSSFYYNTLRVFFGNTQATISSSTKTSLTVLVPEALTEPNPVLSVEYNGVRTNLPGTFSVTSHTITSLSPSSGLPNSTFLINGTNMPIASYYSVNSSVKIGTMNIYPTVVSINQLRATVPDLAAGDYDVSITYGPYTVKAPEKLKVESIVATSFSPSSGGTGKEVTIQGKFNPNQSYQVLFGNLSAYSNSTTATTLKVYVPLTTTYGPVKVIVKSGGQSTEASGDFTILAPAITSFSPTSGVAGTIVTISGSGFTPSNTYYNSNTVKFGTVSTTVNSATESTITAAVPSNLAPGAMKITVVNSNGQTIVSSSNFTVTN